MEEGKGIPKWARWNPSNLMGARCAVRMCTGARSLGKTYAMKKTGIKRFLNKGETWAYVRYYDTMIDRILQSPEGFLSDIQRNNEFPGQVFRTHGRLMQTAYQAQKDTGNIKWKPTWKSLGLMYGLTTFDSYKGATTANMSLMVLDEFIKEKKVPPYPAGCVDMLMNMWETFDRREDRVTLVMLANAADLVNPFFREWGIKPIPKGTSRYFAHGDSEIYYENAWCERFEQYSAKSNIGSFTSGTKYAEFAEQNEFANATGMFVKAKPNRALEVTAIVFKGIEFRVWQDLLTGDVFVDHDMRGAGKKLVLTRDDMTPNYMIIERNSPILKFPLKAYSYGQCYFESDACRELFLEMLTLCGLR